MSLKISFMTTLVNKSFFLRLSCLWILLLIFIGGCSQNRTDESILVINGSTMGTTYSVKIALSESQKKTSDKNKVKSKIESLLKSINQKMSTFIKDSELSKFNRYEKTDWFKVSRDTALVMAEALKVSKKSNGAFDVTIGSLIDLWGFGTKRTMLLADVNTDKKIRKALSSTGYQKLQIKLNPPSIKKSIPLLNCNLSAIAKGFAVDEIAELLNRLQYNNHLVEIGGEVRVKGKKATGPWTIGIFSPDKKKGIHKVVALKDSSMATSGDYMNFYEFKGKRYSHTINPKTGRPITHNLASVTVIHKSCMQADALATTINVLGLEKGLEFATSEHIPVYFIIREKNTFKEVMNTDFKLLLRAYQ